MIKALLSIIAITLTTACTYGQNRFVTPVVGTNTSDQVLIGSNEVAIVRSAYDPFSSGTSGGNFSLEIIKSVQKFRLEAGALNYNYVRVPQSYHFAGPATLTLINGVNPDQRGINAAFCTLEIIPESFPPDKTVIIPAGTGANIIFESSTDLIHWTTNAPGIFTNSPANQFFRIRAERIP